MGEETQPIAGLHRDIEELPHAELLTVLHENHDEQHLWDLSLIHISEPTRP